MPEVKMLSAEECAAVENQILAAALRMGVWPSFNDLYRLLATARKFADLLKEADYHHERCSISLDGADKCDCGLTERSAYLDGWERAADAADPQAVAAPKKEGER